MTFANTATEIQESEIFSAHKGGKICIETTAELNDPHSLAVAYTPGVAAVSQAIAAQPALAERYTWASRLVAVVTDGTAVLGLGDVGPAAALPVMEGKAVLLKRLGGVDAIPLVLDTTDNDEIIETLVRLRPSYGAVSLEDVAAPRCFELERRLVEALDCPVMHDDQHGTAIAVLAALRGACAVVERPLQDRRVVVSGAGAAGLACARILLAAGVSDVTVLDSRGIINRGRPDMNTAKTEVAERTNPRSLSGGLAEAIRGADVFVGLSSSQVPEHLIAAMAPDGIVLALSNPHPEIAPHVAARHVAVVGTGGSDFPNQVINMLASPGMYRGALDAGARRITEHMKLAAAQAIAEVAAGDLSADRIVPHSLDSRVMPAVANAVARAAIEDSTRSLVSRSAAFSKAEQRYDHTTSEHEG
ncbi:NAD(P)-dependent malic enzyme [Saccharopolyspora dendranthemae]|uniref:Malate dehydrogenase (Oxaloacetate-decarboxylating) n=1 Tax=Saccharopolyspora dendranthemae TaxID=1181886 RepID=A0A561U3B8_9PSEU|nr:malic enzyme-like NAD(P)-binding protein [Saccharopolyspora dendranthemae]TWF93847.1 malate dehydrogenase (oxaloacetate-decarboxylating) [Saccharopolyspora dendranthemae]